jgi:hypothetical protein
MLAKVRISSAAADPAGNDQARVVIKDAAKRIQETWFEKRGML